MPAGEVHVDLFSARSLDAGSADVACGKVSLAGSYGAVVGGKILNGATGPTVAGQVQIQVSYDKSGSSFYSYGGAIVGTTGNDDPTPFGPIEFPMGVQWVRAVIGSNTDEAVVYDVRLTIVRTL